MANCHLSGRIPHQSVWELFKRKAEASRTKEDNSDELRRTIQHVAGTFGHVVNDFRATVLRGEEKRGTQTLHNEVWAHLQLSMHERDIIAREAVDLDLRDHPNRLAAAAVAAGPQGRAPKTGHVLPSPQTVHQRLHEPCETMKILLGHGRCPELRALVDGGEDLRDYLNGGYSNFFNGGLGHILADYVQLYVLFNQMLLHGWSPNDIHEAVAEFGGRCPHLGQGATCESILKYRISEALRMACHPHDYRVNMQSDRWQEFSQAVLNRTAELNDVHEFCKDVLFPALYLGAHIFQYNELRHGRLSLDPLSDPAAPTADGWPVEAMVTDLLGYLAGVPIEGSKWTRRRE